jgi:hypothetical protein
MVSLRAILDVLVRGRAAGPPGTCVAPGGACRSDSEIGYSSLPVLRIYDGAPQPTATPMAPARVVRSLVYLVTLVAAGPVAAQRGQDGALVGTVLDTSGSVLVGATVEASSPQLIGGPRTVATDEAGRYRFAFLGPGEYAVEVTRPGFKPTRIAAVVVPPGLAITVDLPMALESVSETVSVTTRPAPIDVRSSASPMALDRALLDALPLSRDAHTYVNLVPGVTEFTAFGGSVRANPLTIDGASANEPGSGTPTTPFGRTWIEEMQIVGLGAPAQHGGYTGVAVNAVTRSGADRFSGLGEYRATATAWTGDNRGGLPPALATAFRPADIDRRWEGIGQAGGPLRRGRLWFFAGAQHYRDDTWLAAVGERTAGAPRPTQSTRRAVAKLNVSGPGLSRLEGLFSRSVETGRHVNAGPLFRPEATTDLDRTDDVWNLRFSAPLGSRWLLEARHGGNHRADVSGATVARRAGPPSHVDVATGVYSGNAPFYRDWDTLVHTAGVAMTGYLTSDASSHELQLGVEHEYARMADAVSQPGGLSYLDEDGQPFQALIWDGATYRGRHRRTTVYAQDAWTMAAVTVEVGLRFDGHRAAPPYPARFRTNAAAPRVGVAWDVGRRHQTVLRAHYGRYFDPMVSSFYNFLDPLSWNPEITAAVVGPDEFVELYRFLPTTGFAIDPDLEPSFVAEWVAGAERALPRGVALKAQLVHRRFEDTIAFVDTATHWEPVQLRDPGPDGRADTADDGGLQTIYNNANPGAAVRMLTNPPQAYRIYRALQLVASRRASTGPTFQASYTWSRTTGNFNNGFSSNAANNDTGTDGVFINPNRAINRDGPTALDFAHSFKALGTLPLPRRWTVSWIYRVESGRRWARQVTYRTRLNQGVENVLAEPFVRRTPTVNVADVRVEKSLRIGPATAGAYVDVFNVTNAGVARAYIAQSGPRFGQPGGWLDPRTVTLGLRLTF